MDEQKIVNLKLCTERYPSSCCVICSHTMCLIWIWFTLSKHGFIWLKVSSFWQTQCYYCYNDHWEWDHAQSGRGVCEKDCFASVHHHSRSEVKQSSCDWSVDVSRGLTSFFSLILNGLKVTWMGLRCPHVHLISHSGGGRRQHHLNCITAQKPDCSHILIDSTIIGTLYVLENVMFQ